MFWGLIMEPQRRYTQLVKKSFHISMAALDVSSSDAEPAQIMCGFEGRNYLLCTLQKNKVLQSALDLNFEVGDEVSFATNGNSHVHLTGYLTDVEEGGEEEEESVEEAVEQPTTKKRLRRASDAVPVKKMKTAELLEAVNSQEEDSDDSDVNLTDLLGDEAEDEEGEEEEDDEDGDAEEQSEDDSEDEDTSELSDEEVEEERPKLNGTPHSKKEKAKILQAQNKQKQDQPKKQEKVKAAKAEPKSDTEKTPKKQKNKDETKTPKDSGKKRTIEGGVVIEDLKQGEGPIAKAGRFVQVYYEGRLKTNNKLFDSANKGNGFKFRLGQREVIRGWDVGVAGMKVGGKRRITCPPNMAYGQKGSPPTIPPNSTLVFDVELRNVT